MLYTTECTSSIQLSASADMLRSHPRGDLLLIAFNHATLSCPAHCFASQGTRVKAATSQRQMLRAALVACADSLAQAQAGLDADEEVRSAGGAAGSSETDTVTLDASEACAVAVRTAAAARALLDRPLNPERVKALSDTAVDGTGVTCAEEEERAIEAAQGAASDAEEAVARLIERVGQIRGIRAKLRALLATSEARFRRASATLAGAKVVSSSPLIEEAARVASAALARARERMRSYLMSSGGEDSVGGDWGGLARDEEAVSEAQGYVTALESFAASAVEADSPEALSAPDGTSEPGDDFTVSPTTRNALGVDSKTAERDALTLAVQWGDVLRGQVAELQLADDPAVAQAMEAAGDATVAAKKLWSPGEDNQDPRSDAAGRAAVEGLATALGRLENAAQDAAESQRERVAGLGAASRRLDRLKATLGSLVESVESAGEPLVSLTADAMRVAVDAAYAADDAALVSVRGDRDPSVGDSRRPLQQPPPPSSPASADFADVVQAAAVAVAQAEATVTKARERASQISAQRVRVLETLVGLAETLSAAGGRLASSSTERDLSSAREAATAVSMAQAALSRARTAAQADLGAWVSDATGIAEAVAEAGELVRLAERSADGPAIVRSTAVGRNEPARVATDQAVAQAEANAQAWLEAEAEGEGDVVAGQGAAGDITSGPKAAGKTVVRKARIGFSERGEGAKTYLPLWMRLQKMVWDSGGSAGPATGENNDPVLENSGEPINSAPTG